MSIIPKKKIVGSQACEFLALILVLYLNIKEVISNYVDSCLTAQTLSINNFALQQVCHYMQLSFILNSIKTAAAKACQHSKILQVAPIYALAPHHPKQVCTYDVIVHGSIAHA